MEDSRPNVARDDRAAIVRRAVAQSATELAQAEQPENVIPRILELIGTACKASRVQLFENEQARDGRITTTQRYEWDAPGIPPTSGFRPLVHLDASAEGLGPLFPRLSKGEACALIAHEAEEPLRRLLQSIGIKSVLMVPIFVAGKWWGIAGFDDCRDERTWSDLEVDTLEVLAALVGAAISRACDFNELANASRIIESSSTLLYRVGAAHPFPIIYASRNVSRYGYRVEDLLQSPTVYIELIHPDDVAAIIGDLGRIAGGSVNEAIRECRLRAADGRYNWFECRMSPVRDKDNRVSAIEGLAIDIDRRKAAESRMERFSLTDQLTGLPNRAAFLELLHNAFNAAKRGAIPFAIFYIDLDHFKDINDVLGHTKGDELLKQVAGRLRANRRTGDVIARFGGDEFAILQMDVADASDAGALATRVLRELSEPSYDIGSEIEITVSIGIAVFAHEIASPEEMLKQADVALYRAKDSGRNQYHFHSEALDISIIERVTLAGDLRHAIERDELELFYQPQVEIPSGRIVGLEALLRWHHPKRGLLLPNHFIPIAEKTGAIVPLGRWVIDTTCRQIGAWRQEGLQLPTVTLNVSAVQLKSLPEFDRDLADILRRWNIEPSAIELELTESVLMETTREHRDIMDRLRTLGVSIAIDDFGTGYSSLGYLRAYHVGHIKIAQEFIKNLEEDSGDIAIVRAAISLGRELGIRVIAEGVETANQLGLLAAAGCELVQGFYFSPPVPAAAMAQLLRQGRLHGGQPAPAADIDPPAAPSRKEVST